MSKTRHNRVKHKKHAKISKHNKTQKIPSDCPIGLKPFESEFSKNMSPRELRVSNSDKKRQFVKELLSKFAPHSIKPQNNFYDYINYQWSKNVTLQEQQKYIVQIDEFRLAQDKVYSELNQIILDYIKTHKDRLATNLKNYYTSVINMNPKNYSKRLAAQSVAHVENMIKADNPWALLAFYNSDEMIATMAPFVWALNPDEKDTKIYRCYVTAHQFSIMDLAVYYDDGKDVAYKARYRKMFKEYINKIFTVCLGSGHGYNPQDILDVEISMFFALGCSEYTTKEEPTYNRVTNEEANKLGFNWHEFARCLGFKKIPKYFITTSLNYLKCGSKLFLENWNSPQWKTYWTFILLQRIVRITADWERIVYDFRGSFERGQEAINETNSVSASLYMSVPFNTFLTNQYVAKYENPQAMKYVRTLCDDLKLVFKRILMRNTWLQPSTKKYAIKKLEHFNFVYGKPEGLREDPDLNYGTILYDNMQKISSWRHRKLITLEGKPTIDIPMMDWNQYPVKMSGSQAYIVNASYTPAKNSIYINLGYIQKPFVDLDERGIEYNLAHIGFTIGHEMSHGFDDWGSKYGWDGSLYDWWTPADKAHFKKIQADVTKQYEEFAARDGIIFDASIATGENLADISGLAICDEYLRDFQDKNEDLIPIRALSYEGFYTYFAFQQRQVVGKKAISAQLKTNPHPLDKYRCNVPLSRSEIFRGLYDIKRGDGMWWHNTDTIW